MSLRRIAALAVAAVVVSGAGLLLSSPTGAVTPSTPITLGANGMTSTSCPVPPLGFYGSIALEPATAVQFRASAGTSDSLTITPAPNSTDPASFSTLPAVPSTGAAPITFTKAATYTLSWQIKIVNALGMVVVTGIQNGELVIDADAAGCKVVLQLPVPSVSAPAVPSPVTSAINGGLGGVVSRGNGALGPVNSAIGSLPTTLPTVPPVPGVPSLPPLPGGTPPVATAPAGGDGPGTSYQPTGPTVADRTGPKGYGSGSGVGGSYVPTTGDSIVAGGQQSVSNGKQSGSGSSAVPGGKNGGSPRTVELASTRPRSAPGALPTLAVILAILVLSGATTFYARTFLLEPAEAPAKVED
jgi:hypothetical protein